MSSEIRKRIKEAGLFQWQVAAKIGVTEATFIRWLRFELPDSRKREVLAAIEALKAEMEVQS